MFTQRNRNLKAFHDKLIVQNRQNREIKSQTPSSHFDTIFILTE